MLNSRPLILASSSPYRQQQLEQLELAFSSESPDVDETPLPGEPAQALAQRLAESKADSVLRRNPGALVIGADQVAEVGGDLLGKPHTLERAQAQLSRCSGESVNFFSAVSVASTERTITEVVVTRVTFSTLEPEVILDYLRREEPFDCAGSFKCEGLGIALFDAISSDDPSALVGLPLIALRKILAQHGRHVLGPQGH